jgi:hypothetical protein
MAGKKKQGRVFLSDCIHNFLPAPGCDSLATWVVPDGSHDYDANGYPAWAHSTLEIMNISTEQISEAVRNGWSCSRT